MLGFFPLTKSAAALGALVLLLAAGSVGYYAGQTGQQVRDVEAPPDTVRRTRTITKTDTVTRTVAETVVRYDTVRIRDTIRVGVPEGFRYLGVIERRPLDISGDQATLTYFRDGRYVQQRYELPKNRWALWPEVEIRTTPWGAQASLQGALRWRDWTVTAGYAFARKRRGWTVGVRWRPVKMSW